MKTLNVIYIIRIGLGALAALLATLVVDLKAGNPLINGITVALAVYILTYYLLKMQFSSKVEKESKVLTMGIGIYFFVFIFCWVLFTTPLLAPPMAEFTVNPDPTTEQLVIGQVITFNATASEDPDGTIVKYSWTFGDGNTTTIEAPIITHTYTTADSYTVRLTIIDEHGISMSNTTPITINNQS
ncbi:MAG: PKD domain-containing protein [Candidatus Bathyarchaeota archaeon]|nr:PKD domain-containing protein [Candidatus Bathyarchaeum sp.]